MTDDATTNGTSSRLRLAETTAQPELLGLRLASLVTRCARRGRMRMRSTPVAVGANSEIGHTIPLDARTRVSDAKPKSFSLKALCSCVRACVGASDPPPRRFSPNSGGVRIGAELGLALTVPYKKKFEVQRRKDPLVVLYGIGNCKPLQGGGRTRTHPPTHERKSLMPRTLSHKA